MTLFFSYYIVLRVLGIPTRAISNFNSAHDTDGNCTYDRYYDENGEFLSRISRDSTWLVFVLFNFFFGDLYIYFANFDQIHEKLSFLVISGTCFPPQ